jgi:hypothetical protein
MPRYFKLEEAQELLPAVEEWLRAAVEAWGRLAEAESEMMDLRRHVIAMGGVRPDAAKALMLKARRESAEAELKKGLEAIEGLGVQVKDLETGLIDFPTLYRGREVLLCFRLGETGIGYWHETDGGFRGRRAIDREFIDHHEGGLGTE